VLALMSPSTSAFDLHREPSPPQQVTHIAFGNSR
jgi:hypothetical protein